MCNGAAAVEAFILGAVSRSAYVVCERPTVRHRTDSRALQAKLMVGFQSSRSSIEAPGKEAHQTLPFNRRNARPQ
jgi:hypothetical protein